MAEVFANSEDPDQMPHSVASDLGLHCLPITLLGVSQLQWVKCVQKLKIGSSENLTQQGPLNEYLQHTFSWRNKKTFIFVKSKKS